MVLSLRVNVPMQLAIVESSGSITILEELLPITSLDKFYVSDITNYNQIKSGEIIPDIGMKMIDFTSNHITNVVTSSIKINPDSKVKSVIIKLVDNANSDIINLSLQNALKTLPEIQPEVIQIVLNFILSDKTIRTDDYSYEGPLTWSMCVYYNTTNNNTTTNNYTNNYTNTYYTKNNLEPNL
jgi:hypothetical protein